MKGYIMLSEGRSGSNWLGSMANKTKKLGHMTEWLGQEYFDKKIDQYTVDEFVGMVMGKAVSENGRFAIKIFPRHIHYVNAHLGFDFIRKCMDEHETKLIFLTRRDTFAQAISLVRGIQTRQWTSRNEKSGSEEYDFSALCRAYFYISRSNQYWDAYLGVNNFDHDRFVYEDLLSDPTPLLETIADALDVQEQLEWNTDLKIQRDTKTKEWLERFREDVKSQNVVSFSGSFGGFQSFGNHLDSKKVRWSARKLKKLFK